MAHEGGVPIYKETGLEEILPLAPDQYGDKFQLTLWIDLEYCTGCRACTTNCKSENNTPIGMDYNRVIYVEQGSYPDTKRYFVPMPCMHCGKPPCLAACPVGAISKHEVNGIVEFDTDKCIGCKYCVWACPFGAPQFNQDKRVTQKCTLCSHKTVDPDSGQPSGERPACVDTCVGRVRWFGDQNWLASGRRKTRALSAVGGTPTVLYTDPKTA